MAVRLELLPHDHHKIVGNKALLRWAGVWDIPFGWNPRDGP